MTPEEIRKQVNTQVKVYMIVVVSVLLAANTVGIVVYLRYLWSDAAAAAKMKYESEAKVFRVLLESELKSGMVDLKAEFAKQGKELEETYSASYARKLSQEIVPKILKAELLVDNASGDAIKRAKKASDSAEIAFGQSESARKKSNQALRQAEEAANEVRSTLETLRSAEEREISKAIATMIELLEARDGDPIASLNEKVESLASLLKQPEVIIQVPESKVPLKFGKRNERIYPNQFLAEIDVKKGDHVLARFGGNVFAKKGVASKKGVAIYSQVYSQEGEGDATTGRSTYAIHPTDGSHYKYGMSQDVFVAREDGKMKVGVSLHASAATSGVVSYGSLTVTNLGNSKAK